jgi:hypothetical protein
VIIFVYYIYHLTIYNLPLIVLFGNLRFP